VKDLDPEGKEPGRRGVEERKTPLILPFQEEAIAGPVYRRKPEGLRIIALGGGKGGVGRTVLAANIGIYLAQAGKKVVLVDADLGGANLHTCLAMEIPALNLSDFLAGRVKHVEEVAQATTIAGLSFIAGSRELGSTNPKHPQKLRFLEKIRTMEVDFVILDLAAGTSFSTLDFFLAADRGVLVVVPEPTSIEAGYRFLESAFFRDLYSPGIHEGEAPWTRKLLEIVAQRGGEKLSTPLELAAEVGAQDLESGRFVRRRLARFRPYLLVNQARTTADGRLPEAIRSVCRRRFGIELETLAPVEYDDAVWMSVRRRRPLLLEYPESPATKSIVALARRLMAVQAPQTPADAAPSGG
jgi:flagellar biosynthesis protein FlhG